MLLALTCKWMRARIPPFASVSCNWSRRYCPLTFGSSKTHKHFSDSVSGRIPARLLKVSHPRLLRNKSPKNWNWVVQVQISSTSCITFAATPKIWKSWKKRERAPRAFYFQLRAKGHVGQKMLLVLGEHHGESSERSVHSGAWGKYQLSLVSFRARFQTHLFIQVAIRCIVEGNRPVPEKEIQPWVGKLQASWVFWRHPR